jgi:hypothetical protein
MDEVWKILDARRALAAERLSPLDRYQLPDERLGQRPIDWELEGTR